MLEGLFERGSCLLPFFQKAGQGKAGASQKVDEISGRKAAPKPYGLGFFHKLGTLGRGCLTALSSFGKRCYDRICQKTVEGQECFQGW